MNHSRDREDTEEDVSLNLNAAVCQMRLIPSQVPAHPTVRRFITGDTSSARMTQARPAHTGRSVPAKGMNTDGCVRSPPLTKQQTDRTGQKLHSAAHRYGTHKTNDT